MRRSTAVRSRRNVVLATAALTLSLLSACSDDATRPIIKIDPPSTIAVAFCGAPTWVAFQDGDGGWTRAQPTPAAPFVSFHNTFSAPHGGIAIARELSGGLTALSVLYGTPDELLIASDTAGTSCGQTTFKTLLGTVAPLDSNELVRLDAGRGSQGDFVTRGNGPDFAIGRLTDGPHEILATRAALIDGKIAVTAIILRRTPTLPDKTVLPVFDFTSDEAFQPVVHTLTLGGPAAGVVTGFTGVRTAHGDNSLTFFQSTGVGTTVQYDAIPDARLEPGELQSLVLTSAPVGNVVRGAIAYFASAVDRTVTFGALPSPPDITVASTTPVLRMRARFASEQDYDQLTSINYQQGQNTIVSIAMTSAYSTSAGGYDLIVPDFAGVDGFDARWALRPTGQVLWTSGRIGGTLGLSFGAVPVNGATRRSATDAGFITP